ncbi:hypothetical protein ACE38W_14505 [Chitinophaga sp. Hz27]|uniref:hypothetical protein n=1 Tax=Chitinophaga sp. Hz27 TaxID=3347169 RepID=UPI0035DC8019
MTWKDYSRYAQGYWIRHYRQMEGPRLIAYMIAAANRDPKKSFPRSVEHFMPFPTDPKRVIKQQDISKEEYDKIIQRYSKPVSNG